MDFYLIASSRPFAHGQITWLLMALCIGLIVKIYLLYPCYLTITSLGKALPCLLNAFILEL